jgi:Thioredoxin domain-containing protein
MKIKGSIWQSGLIVVFIFCVIMTGAAAEKLENVPVKGMVTMIDLGAKSCIPCRMMAPILEKMKNLYEGKTAIVFIDVWKHRDQARRFGIRAIPTQIFFNEEGREIYRHVGFMSEAAICEQLKKWALRRLRKRRTNA